MHTIILKKDPSTNIKNGPYDINKNNFELWFANRNIIMMFSFD